jgi:hypothetical protein
MHELIAISNLVSSSKKLRQSNERVDEENKMEKLFSQRSQESVTALVKEQQESKFEPILSLKTKRNRNKKCAT